MSLLRVSHWKSGNQWLQRCRGTVSTRCSMGGGFPESLNVNKLYQTLLHSIVLLCGDHSVTDCDMARTMRVSGKEPKNKGWLARQCGAGLHSGVTFQVTSAELSFWRRWSGLGAPRKIWQCLGELESGQQPREPRMGWRTLVNFPGSRGNQLLT